jgi:myo-inositol 2-dehydrogenase/D-chiro-inositol 1-dehydrogenase
MTIRVGLIGAGIMGADHAKIMATQVPGARLQSICDADGSRAKTIADETGAHRTDADPFAVIAASDIDAVVIASPDQTHASLTIAAIESGKPVLCEKPMAPSPADCLKVIEAEVKRGKRLVQVGFMRRFDPSYAEMKRVLASGAIGKALMLHCIHRNVAAPDWFTSDMAITNSLPHEFDIARYLLETEFQSIGVSQPRSVGAFKKVAPVFAVLETKQGELVTMEMNNNATYGYDVRGELVGEKGTVSLRSPMRSETNLALTRAETYPQDWRSWFAEAYRLQNQAWIASIATGKPTGASAWDGYAAAAIAEAGVKALASGGAETIELEAKPALYR